LIAVLNWGLGHATRCIPIINHLLAKQHKVVLVSDGLALQFLQQTFPNLNYEILPAYNIKYPQYGNMFFSMMCQTPRLLHTIKQSHKFVNSIIDEHQIDYIISDNRYGCYHKKVPSIFITHQVNIPLPKPFTWFQSLVDQQNFRYINQYDILWVPDIEGHLLSGSLSFANRRCSIPTQFIGLLSRMRHRTVDCENFALVVLSGPEPQRSIFEQKIINQSKFYNGKVILVRGSKSTLKQQVPGNLEYIDVADSITLNDLMLKAKHIICRSGYSSLMDLVALQRTAFIVPTPGQTEQEYLAQRMKDQRRFISCPQTLFNLNKAIQQLANFKAIHFKYMDDGLLDKAITHLEEFKKEKPLSEIG